MTIENIIPILIILFFGLPHGAADILIAKRLLNNKYKYIFYFFIIYSLIAIIFSIIWLIIPIISLVFFFIISVSHFGLLDTHKTNKLPYRNIRAILYGFTPIIIPVVFHTSEVNILFSLLLFSNSIELSSFIIPIFPIWLTGNLIFLISGGVDTKIEFLEISLLASILIILPPLWGFATYFCLIHSMRHSRNVINKLGYLSKSDLMALSGIITLSLTVIFLGAYLITTNNFGESLIRLTFISLGSLTIPHIILIDLYKGLNRIKV